VFEIGPLLDKISDFVLCELRSAIILDCGLNR
jgi:hypothetical protein